MTDKKKWQVWSMYKIRRMQQEEYGYLEDFLYEAVFVPEGEEPPEKSIIYQPDLQVYVKHFGELKDDYALVAEADGKIVGAAWARIMDDYGHIDEDTPSIAISLYKEYRGQGIGSELLRSLLRVLKEAGYKRVSLSVQKANYAAKMYEKAGFKILLDKDEEYIMAAQLSVEKLPDTVFESERIAFVKISESLVQEYLDMVNDLENVARFIGERTTPYTRVEELKFIENKLAENAVIFSMLDKENGDFIGNIEFMDIEDGCGELGIAITASKQNRQYGREAIHKMLEYGFSGLKLTRVFLKVYPYNKRAIHVYEDCGFTRYDENDHDIFMEIFPN